MTKDLLTRLQLWYKMNCDGDWEHTYGIAIDTLDNPGWTIKIDLAETPLHHLQFDLTKEKDSNDWFFIKAKDGIFKAACGPENLLDVLRIFLDEIIPHNIDNNFHYEVYVPLKGGPIEIWRPVKAKMLTEEILEIVEIPELKYEDIEVKNVQDVTFEREDIFTYSTEYQVGNKIKTELTAQLNDYYGVKLIAKENNDNGS